MIRRYSVIEPIIGHMKADGKLDRNGLNGALGDAISTGYWAIPFMRCCAGHNLHMISRKLQLFYTLILPALLNRDAHMVSAV